MKTQDIVNHFKAQALSVMLDLEKKGNEFEVDLLEEALFKACHHLAKQGGNHEEAKQKH